MGNGIRINLMKTGWSSVDWILLSQDRDQWWDILNTVISFLVQ